MRIISLIASSTEIIHALGLGDLMVGRSHECDYPVEVKDLPVCTEPKFRTDGSSFEIDQRVKTIVQESLSVYRVKVDMLEQLRPTHIVTQAQCEVCAVSLKDVEQATCQLLHSNPLVVSLQPDCLNDIYKDIVRVGTATGVKAAADTLVESLQGRIAEIEAIAGKQPRKPRVAVIEWIDPLMAAGNWMPELVELAGGENLFGEAGKHSPWMSWEELVEKDPDVIIVTPCGFDLTRTLEEMHLLSSKPAYDRLRAVKSDRIAVADGNQFFNRPGPRVVESLEIMAEILHPERFAFGHYGKGWVRYGV